jgi:hypothetical protein
VPDRGDLVQATAIGLPLEIASMRGVVMEVDRMRQVIAVRTRGGTFGCAMQSAFVIQKATDR